MEDNMEQGGLRYEKTDRKQENKTRTGHIGSGTERIRESRVGFTAGEINGCNDEMCSISQ